MGEYDLQLSKLEDAFTKAKGQEKIVFTSFLDPSMQLISEREIGRYQGLDYIMWGGSLYCERKIMGIFPEGFNVSESDFPICVLFCENKNNIRHPDVMGALLNMGIERSKIGDIQVNEDIIQIFAIDTLGEFIENELVKISRYPVSFKRIAFDKVVTLQPKFTALNLIVPSMRLDAVISNIFKLSRNEANLFVKGQKVFVNHQVISKPGYNVKEGDLISVRTKGRAIVNAQNGTTKKGNIKLSVNKFS